MSFKVEQVLRPTSFKKRKASESKKCCIKDMEEQYGKPNDCRKLRELRKKTTK